MSEEKNLAELEGYAKSVGVSNLDELLAFPRFLFICPTTVCNGDCIMCTIKDWNKDAPYMSDALFDKIVADITPDADKIQRVTLQLNGEPLMDKKLEDKIAKLKKIGIPNIYFSTNGSLMTEKRAYSLLESGIDEIYFSIDGYSRDVFNHIRCGLDFDTIIENTRRFIDIRNKGNFNTRISVRMVAMDENEHEIDDFLKYWHPLLGTEDRVYCKPKHHWGNWLKHKITPEDLEKPYNNSPCPALWGNMVILTDGRVVLCTSDFNSRKLLGNVNEQSIKEIWQSEVLKTIRTKHMQKGRKGLGMCVNCPTWVEEIRIYPKDRGIE